MNTKTIELLRQKNSTLNSMKMLFQLLLSDRYVLGSILMFGLTPLVILIIATSVILGSDSQKWYFVFGLVYSVTNIIVLNAILRRTFSFFEIPTQTSSTTISDLVSYCLMTALISILPYLVENTFHPSVFLSAALIALSIYLSFCVMNAFIELQVTGERPEYDVWGIVKKASGRVYSGIRTYMGVGFVFLTLSIPFFIGFAMGSQVSVNRIISYVVAGLSGCFFPALFLTDYVKHHFYLTNETRI